jgi:tRNA(Ile)-lysidine synthase
MALLLALHHAQRQIVVGHINHGIRGVESDADEAFVLNHCRSLGIPVFGIRVTLSKHPGEDEARRARYQVLLQLAREQSCTLLATGHTATDSLETTLINLLRGAAVEGLAGIRPCREIAPDLLVVRPLWQTGREDVHRFLAASGWPHREDSSNATDHYLRNRVRHNLLPQLAALAPGASAMGGSSLLAEQSARAASLLRDDLDCLDELARAHLHTLIRRDEPALLTFDGLGFTALPVALQRRILREATRRVRGSLDGITAEHIEVTRRQITTNGRRAVWCWPTGLRVEWTGDMAGNRVRFWLVQKEQHH